MFVILPPALDSDGTGAVTAITPIFNVGQSVLVDVVVHTLLISRKRKPVQDPVLVTKKIVQNVGRLKMTMSPVHHMKPTPNV
jgi:hypothetical protein